MERLPAHWTRFRDYPGNPVITPPFPEWMIADPTVLVPADSPDDRWHLFAWSLRGIQHYQSRDGYDWRHTAGPLFPGLRPCIRYDDGLYYLFYERYYRLNRSAVSVRWSHNLKAWSEPRDLLLPEYEWEGTFPAANGNPCLLKGPFGYRLYYSASAVFLKDCLFIEPRHIGVAEADHILGPYRKRRHPILSPSPFEPYRNFGAGAIKVYLENGRFVGVNNGIYLDSEGRSRSAILILDSDDGFVFRSAQPEPVLSPEGSGWKRALVYALEVVRHGNELRLYYNGRSGWFIGAERIGVAVSPVIP